MKILEIYIDGYRNIKNTRLSLNTPIVVLLSQNNFGKTNLIEGIFYGFRFLCLSLKRADEYIRVADYENSFEDEKHNFTFEVTFETNSDKIYRYKYSLGFHKYFDARCICEEELYFKNSNSDSEYEPILVRDSDSPDSAELFSYKNKSKKTQKKYNFTKNTIAAFAKPFLHAFGEIALEGDSSISRFAELYSVELRDIFQEVYMNLVQGETIGEILIDETTNLQNFSELAESLLLLNGDAYAQFENTFKSLFPSYSNVRVEKDAADNPYLVFTKKHSGKKETVKTLSFGTRRMLRIIEKVLLNNSPIVSVEELENGIHANLYSNVLNNLVKLLNRYNSSTLIITSHSVNLVNLFTSFQESIYLGLDGYMQKEKGQARFVRFTEKGIIELEKEIENIGAESNIGSVIYDYIENEKYSNKMRSWLET